MGPRTTSVRHGGRSYVLCTVGCFLGYSSSLSYLSEEGSAIRMIGCVGIGEYVRVRIKDWHTSRLRWSTERLCCLHLELQTPATTGWILLMLALD
jgi:hypothetical protein